MGYTVEQYHSELRQFAVDAIKDGDLENTGYFVPDAGALDNLLGVVMGFNNLDFPEE